jgi:hypothetical protein
VKEIDQFALVMIHGFAKLSAPAKAGDAVALGLTAPQHLVSMSLRRPVTL